MNIVDIIIILALLTAGITGYKRGFFKEFVLCVGIILVFYLSYILKDFVGNYLLLNLPMFDFPGVFKGVVTLNILVYQSLAFVIILCLLLIIFNFILSITGLFEKLLRITIILGIPSKILGFFAGLLEGYVIIFVLLFFLTQPSFNFTFFQESTLSNKILTSSPFLTNITSDTVTLMQDIYDLKDEEDKDIMNSKILNMMLEKKVVSYDTANELYKNGKIDFNGIENVLQKYEVTE